MALGLQNQYSRFSGGSTPIHNVPFPRSQNHQGGRLDLAQDLDMMLLSRHHSTGLLHSVRLTGTQFTEECWACNSPLYQHLSHPGWHELRPSFWACLNAHHGMHIRIYCRDAHLDLSSGKEPNRIAGSLVLAAQNATCSYRHD